MALIITIKVIPSSGKILWTYDKQGRIKLFIKSPAQQGKGNKEVTTIIARTLQIPLNKVSIIRGQTSPLKMIKIDTPLSLTLFLQLSGLDVQQSFLPHN